MMGVPGVAARAFSALEHEGISVSIISQASSEHSICIGVTDRAADAAASALATAFAPQIASGEIDGVEVRRGVATIAIVGSGMAGSPGIAARFFTALADARVNVVAIAQGTSELNISVVIDEADAPAAQRAVHAAFGLSKIGGGTGARHEHADVVLLGFGQIGRALTKQIADSGAHRTARIVGIIDRTGYVFNAKGIGLRRVAALAAAKRAGRSLSALADGITAAPLDALRAIAEHHLSRPILVDVTASDSASLLEAAMALGMDVVLANKKPLADERTGPALSAIATTNGRRLMTEATVGAGLPIIDTIQKLQESGDDVLRIEGCPSGTLGYLFGELGRGVPFSTAVLAAKSLGYTEPDPRDDLSGTDVARKALILGRLLGFEGELRDIRVQSLVPASMASLTDAEFLQQLPSLDASWDRRVRAALARGTVLRYRALVTKKRVVVGVVAMDAASSFGVLTGTDNQFAFTTRRYRTNPLVITGAGAGAAVTAAGVLNDILKLAGAR
jgi:aspartokinase/homoserine dehydrogenase 1